MKKINPKGTSWNELEKELFTPEEISESDKRVAAINETIKANAMNHNDPTCTEIYVRGNKNKNVNLGLRKKFEETKRYLNIK